MVVRGGVFFIFSLVAFCRRFGLGGLACEQCRCRNVFVDNYFTDVFLRKVRFTGRGSFGLRQCEVGDRHCKG